MSIHQKSKIYLICRGRRGLAPPPAGPSPRKRYQAPPAAGLSPRLRFGGAWPRRGEAGAYPGSRTTLKIIKKSGQLGIIFFVEITGKKNRTAQHHFFKIIKTNRTARHHFFKIIKKNRTAQQHFSKLKKKQDSSASCFSKFYKKTGQLETIFQNF